VPVITVTVTSESESESPCGPDGARRPRRFFEHCGTLPRPQVSLWQLPVSQAGSHCACMSDTPRRRWHSTLSC
jgi:hypothetical protein